MQQLPHKAFVQDQKLIQAIKSRFTETLCDALSLIEVQAPILTIKGDGVQDDLNGIERPVSVSSKTLNKQLEVVQSLAKWKRLLLARGGFQPGHGIVAQMRALRPDEESLSERHSLYVDQWDWEKVVSAEQRNIDFLKQTVEQIYGAMRSVDLFIAQQMGREPILPEQITFIHSETLRQRYPELTAKQREHEICKEYGSVFLMGIGGQLADGTIHDGRAPDYDDWSTPTSEGLHGLNGDILVWNPILQDAFELSSMGIRVCKDALLRQLTLRQCEYRLHMPWHQKLVKDQLPLTIGGGIGQSRLIMLLLMKAHIGQVQFSVWPDEVAVGLL
ncbi:aspartate--ammonia ligase [Kangiella koreensis]|uniref:Aspartate--ammonia ligase n=1 Tax=Kangiella koreensis (strain DSM 16069 / JCM 12317 / KCTC 12182 / SW-125) TaxID=523791 RepID=C7R8X1_KANKD|nr:aspartate--ammonia ligase [Kangiella koreensis]ACV25984.1 aspartate/ammonia ligase [Kangiella koreensis DSM 16069]